MDLEKAYIKIDNFCCLNQIMLQGNKVKYPNGEEKIIDMFRYYQETKDEDFCKDVCEMVKALETIKQLVDLQKEIGCPLDVFIKLLIRQECYFKDHENDTFKTKGTIDMNSIDFEKKRFTVWYECIDGSSDYIFLFFEDYKKYWWLSK